MLPQQRVSGTTPDVPVNQEVSAQRGFQLHGLTTAYQGSELLGILALDGTISNKPRGYEDMALEMARHLLLLGGIDTLRSYYAGSSARISLDWGILSPE